MASARKGVPIWTYPQSERRSVELRICQHMPDADNSTVHFGYQHRTISRKHMAVEVRPVEAGDGVSTHIGG